VVSSWETGYAMPSGDVESIAVYADGLVAQCALGDAVALVLAMKVCGWSIRPSRVAMIIIQSRPRRARVSGNADGPRRWAMWAKELVARRRGGVVIEELESRRTT